VEVGQGTSLSFVVVVGIGIIMRDCTKKQLDKRQMRYLKKHQDFAVHLLYWRMAVDGLYFTFYRFFIYFCEATRKVFSYR